MANQLKTTLELDIKPFLDAIKRAAQQVSTLEELRPKFDTTEFQNLQRQIAGFNPNINVGVTVEDQSIEEAQKKINRIEEDTVTIPVDINAEQINRELGRVGELRPRISQGELTRVANQIRNLRPNLNVDFNADRGSINNLQNEITQLNQDVNLDIIVDDAQLQDTKKQVQIIESESIDVPVIVNSEEIIRSINRVRELRDATRAIPPLTNLEVDFNAEEVNREIDELRKKLTFPISAKAQLEGFDDIKKSIQSRVDELDQKVQIGVELDPEELGNLEFLKSELAKADQYKADLEVRANTEEALGELQKVERKIDDVSGDDVTTNVKVTGTQQANSQLDSVEKNINDLPNQKNIKVNVDQAGVRNITKTTGAIGGFTKQLGSGLLASFSGAAIGAAIAGFATQAVRAIVSASDAADELQDKLRLAFTQAGAEGFDLDTNLQRANEFAFQLGDSFGISIRRTQELLAQVVGLTGEFGATSEAITKASIGIEEATGGLVKAETAAKLFSRSIGNPEDQAALETLAKRFPAIGEAILGATDPAEKANAVLSNLTGTFTALEEKALGFGENLQLLSEVTFATFAAAVVPIGDSLVPLLERLTDLILANADSIEAFGRNIADNFITPFLDQLQRLGPSFETFFSNLGDTIAIIGQAGFTTFTASFEALAYVLEITGNLLQILNPLLSQLGTIIQQVLQPIVERLSSDFGGLSGPLEQASGGVLQFSDNAFKLGPILETIKNLVELLNPVITLTGNIILLALVPSLDALETALQAVLLPFRALNFLFDVGKGFIKEYGDTLRNFVNDVLIYIPTVFALVKGLELLNRLSSQPIGINNIGNTEPIEKLDATLFDAVDTGQKFEQQYGIRIPRATRAASRAIGGASAATKTATKDLETELAKQLKAYQDIEKVIESRYAIEIQNIDRAQKLKSLALNRELTDIEKIEFQKQKIAVLNAKELALQKELQSQFGVNTNELNKLVGLYTGAVSGSTFIADPSAFGIKFDATDPQQVEDAKRVAEEIVKLYTNILQIESEQAEYQLELRNVTIKTNQENIRTQFDLLQLDIQRTLQQVELGIPLNFSFGAQDIGDQLNVFVVRLQELRKSAEAELDPTRKRIKELEDSIRGLAGTGTQLSSVTGQLNELTGEYEQTGAATENTKDKLTEYTAELVKLREQTQQYNDTINKTRELENSVTDSIENALRTQFRNQFQRESFFVQIELDAAGVNRGLVEIRENFREQLGQIQVESLAATARFKKIIGDQIGALQDSFEAGAISIEEFNQKVTELNQKQADSLASITQGQQNLTRTIKAQREIAVREFQLQNDAIFAITDSLRRNLAEAITPDNTKAKAAFDERKQEINNELELLRTNLELRTISYQDYNEQVLELEREKRDAIKEYDDEVAQNRLRAFQEIANDALPAINKQLEVASAELTVLLKDNATEFVDIANKSLENLALIGAQSLGIALQQAESLEEVQKLFIKSLVRNTLQALQVQLVGAILQGIFRDVEKAGTLGLITGALIGGALTALFLKAEQEILKLAGYESGGYTGDVGTKDVAGVVHGQEYVVNAQNTKPNRPLLDWINKGNSAESFFKNSSPDVSVDNYVDTKAINQSINTLAYTMDSRLSSLETTVDNAIRQNATLTKSANQLDVSVYSDPGTAIKYMKKMGKIKGLS